MSAIMTMYEQRSPKHDVIRQMSDVHIPIFPNAAPAIPKNKKSNEGSQWSGRERNMKGDRKNQPLKVALLDCPVISALFTINPMQKRP